MPAGEHKVLKESTNVQTLASVALQRLRSHTKYRVLAANDDSANCGVGMLSIDGVVVAPALCHWCCSTVRNIEVCCLL